MSRVGFSFPQPEHLQRRLVEDRKDMAQKIADAGGRGRILYNYLSDMQNKAEKIETAEEPRFQLRIDVPFIDPKTQANSWLPAGSESHASNSPHDLITSR